MDGRVLSRKYRDSIPSEKSTTVAQNSQCALINAYMQDSKVQLHKYTYIHTYLNDLEMRIIVIASQERLSEVAVA